MDIIEYKYPEKILPRNSVCALGFFDGVHLGHRDIIKEAVRVARDEDLIPTVFTFPSESLNIKADQPRIYSTEEKLKIFSELGVECTVLCDFSSVAGLSPIDFVSLLFSGFGARVAISGEDFRFGAGASGDTALLTREMSRLGGRAIVRKMVEITPPDEGRVEISATAIRKYLALGRVDFATEMLGEPYRITSVALHGRGDGHTLGFPTVNMDIGKTPLMRGVYHTRLSADGEEYDALTNLGTCPTFGERVLHAETHIPGFSGDLYGKNITLRFISFIREERRFASEEEFRREVERNIKSIRGEK